MFVHKNEEATHDFVWMKAEFSSSDQSEAFVLFASDSQRRHLPPLPPGLAI